MSARAPGGVDRLPPQRKAAMQMALENAAQRAVLWGLPDLEGEQGRTRAIGWLCRDRALVLIERDLVGLSARRRRRAPWGELWAPDWWATVIVPAASAQVAAAWWARRAPRPALEWARLLDPDASQKSGPAGILGVQEFNEDDGAGVWQ